MKFTPLSLALFSLVSFALAPLSAVQAQNQPSASPINPMPSMPPMPMAQMNGMHKPAGPAGPLKITYGDKSATWTPAELAALPQTRVTVINVHTKANDTYTGVPLIDLLTRMGLSPKPHGKELRLYVVAVGSDGYQVTYGMGEIAPYIHDAPTIVADTENGKALTSDGPLKLISSGDKMPERWVRNLAAIRVLAAQ